MIPYGTLVPVDVWQPRELLYSCYFTFFTNCSTHYLKYKVAQKKWSILDSIFTQPYLVCADRRVGPNIGLCISFMRRDPTQQSFAEFLATVNRCNNNNNNHDDVYGAIIMTKIIARLHSVHLMNAD